ncbi:hypothetical protein KKE68_02115, partial [Patescibacteria group bacterium]|nr:hypothetical protein [Patescibacteria group bacterium]
QELLNIFGQNLFTKTTLVPIYKKLLGVMQIKPFDCVGTPEEVQTAFYLAMKSGEYDNDKAMRFFKEAVLSKIKNIDTMSKEVFNLSDEHRIPREFREVLKVD